MHSSPLPRPRRPLAAVSLRAALCKTAFLALAATAILPNHSRAAVDTWTGAGADNNWSTTGNFTPDVPPLTGDSLLYTGTATRLTSNNNGTANALTIAGITFDATAAAYALTGNAINLSADIVNNSVNAQSIGMNLVLTNTANTNFSSLGGGNLTFSGNISGTGVASSGAVTTGTPTFALTVTGTNAGGTSAANGTNTTTTFSGTNTYTGATRFTGGSVALNYGTTNGNKLDANSALFLGGPPALGGVTNPTNSGVNLTVTGSTNTVQTVASTVIDAGNSNISVTTAGATLNLGSVSSRSGGSVLLNTNPATGTVGAITATSNVNGILGGYAITTSNNGGSNPATANFVASSGAAGTASTLTAFGAYTTDFTVTNANIQNASTTAVTLAPAQFTINSLKTSESTTLTLASGTNTITSGGLLFFGGTAGVNTINGPGTLTSGSPDLDIFISGSSNNLTINAGITGSIGLVVAPVSANTAATVVLQGTNTFTGNIAVTRSVLALNSALPAATAGHTITLNEVYGSSILTTLTDGETAANSTLTINAANYLIQGGGGVVKSGAATNTLQLLGAHTYTGGTTLNTGTTVVDTLANGGVASSLGAASNAAANLVLNATSGDNPVLQYTGPTVSTDRLFTLSGTSSTGTVALDASGTGPVSFTNTGTELGGTNGAPTLILQGSNAGANTFASVLPNFGTGTTKLTKQGAGTWVLTGNNSYTGATTVTAGALGFNNALTAAAVAGTGVVNVNGGTLFGSGATPSGLLTVASGASLTPGASLAAGTTHAATVGIMTVGALTLTATAGAGSNFNVLLTNNGSTTGVGAGLTYSQLVANGAVALGGNINLTLGNNLVVGDKFFVLLNSGTTTGTFSNVTGTSFTSGGDTFSINYADTGDATAGNDVSLTVTAVTAVPEPSAWVGATALCAVIGWKLRRRRA